MVLCRWRIIIFGAFMFWKKTRRYPVSQAEHSVMMNRLSLLANTFTREDLGRTVKRLVAIRASVRDQTREQDKTGFGKIGDLSCASFVFYGANTILNNGYIEKAIEKAFVGDFMAMVGHGERRNDFVEPALKQPDFHSHKTWFAKQLALLLCGKTEMEEVGGQMVESAALIESDGLSFCSIARVAEAFEDYDTIKRMKAQRKDWERGLAAQYEALKASITGEKAEKAIFKKKDRSQVIRHAAQELATHLAAAHGVARISGDFMSQLSQDAYMAGYLDGKTATFLLAALQEGSSSHEDLAQEYGVAISRALTIFLGEEDGREYVVATRKHRNERSAEYLAGQKKGQTITQYYMRVADVSDDPDYTKALLLGRKAEALVSEIGDGTVSIDDTEAALIGLEEIWFISKKW